MRTQRITQNTLKRVAEFNKTVAATCPTQVLNTIKQIIRTQQHLSGTILVLKYAAKIMYSATKWLEVRISKTAPTKTTL